MKVTRYCIYCDDVVKKGEGGMCTVPFALSNRPTTSVCIHTHCLKPYLTQVEATRPSMPANIDLDVEGNPLHPWDGRVPRFIGQRA